MRNFAIGLASCLYLLSAGASWGQPSDGLQAPPSTSACWSSAPHFVRFELTDGVGAIMVNPCMVTVVRAAVEKPKEWSQLRWTDGHTDLVKGTPEEVSQKLTRSAGSP